LPKTAPVIFYIFTLVGLTSIVFERGESSHAEAIFAVVATFVTQGYPSCLPPECNAISRIFSAAISVQRRLSLPADVDAALLALFTGDGL
jgi:hypothetical protein